MFDRPEPCLSSPVGTARVPSRRPRGLCTILLMVAVLGGCSLPATRSAPDGTGESSAMASRSGDTSAPSGQAGAATDSPSRGTGQVAASARVSLIQRLLNRRPATPAVPRTRPVDATVSDNLVAVLTQVLPPINTTIQVREGKDPLWRLLVNRLGRAGYGIQRVDADLGANLMRHERRTVSPGADTPAGQSRLFYSLAVGDIEISRHYRLNSAGSLQPDSPVEIAGTRARATVDDAALFGVDRTADTVSRVSYRAPEPMSATVPSISLITPAVVQRLASSASTGPTYQALNSGQVEVVNRFYADSGSFGGLADNYETLDSQVVVFANDSMRLGDRGKQQIRTFARQYRERSDLISLVGCSNGYTALAIGNEGLALGRSKRVSEELMSLGIAREQILDEGCWAATSAGDRFPSRGVVLELLRSKR